MAESVKECDHDLEFKKRSGTDNEGGDYELYLSALYAVKLALDDAVRDIQMASNVDKYGAFDDIVIRVQYKNGSTILYLLQLKHKKKVHGSVDFINKTKGDFSLEKYKDSYYKYIKERIAKGELDDLLRGVELKDVVFCLFTNAVYSKDTSKIILNERASLSCKALPRPGTDFIDTTPEGHHHVFEMHTERPGFAQFLNSHSFTGYQKGFEDRIKKIEGKFGKVKKICNSFKEKLKFEIQKDEMDFDGVLIRVKELLKEVDSDVLEEMSGYFRDEHQSAWKLYEEYPSKCAEYSEFFQRFRFYGGQLNCGEVKAAIASRIRQSLGKFQSKVVRKFIDYVRDYFQGERLLVKRQIQRKLLELMLGPLEEDFEKRLQVFQMVNDLNDAKQKLMVSQKIKVVLQGRNETGLCGIVDSDFCQTLPPEFLLRHMGGVIQVGKKLELNCENYIKRRFVKMYLPWDLLWKCSDCIFVVSVSESCNSLDRVQRHTEIIDVRNRENLPKYFLDAPKNCVVLISSKGHDVDGQAKTLMKTMTNVKGVHYLNEAGDLLEWKGSRNLMNFEGHNCVLENNYFSEREGASLEEENLLRHFTSTIKIISAEPGMGKSTVLDSLIRYCPTNKWALKLRLNEWNNDLHNRLQEILEDPLRYIFEKSEDACDDQFSKDLFAYMKNRDAVMVFIDAFDEISPRYTDGVLKLISKLEHLGISTWVFTRPNLEECLEKNFKTAAIKLLPLSELEIREYLLKNKLSLDGLPQEMRTFLKIPLHLYMLSAIPYLNLHDLQVTDLYESFITTKCEIYYKKSGIDMERNHIAEIVTKPETLIEKHQLLSFLVTVNRRFLEKNNIVSHSELERLLSEVKEYKNHFGLVSVAYGSAPIFSHRTFAEYLTARWLSTSTTHKAFKCMYEYLKRRDVVQFWFNKIVAREHPLHAAVVDGNLELVRRLCHNQTGLVSCDSLKRTPLHLAMGYFENQHFHGRLDEKFLESKNCEVACGVMNEICEHFGDSQSFVSQKDIFGSHWHDQVASFNQTFFASCYWGCKAVMMMYLARNYFLDEYKDDIRKGIEYVARGGHVDCLRLLFVCDAFGEYFEEIKSLLGLASKPDPSPTNQYLWENFEAELVYALKFFIVNDSPYKSDPRFKQRFYNERVFNKLLEDTKRKFKSGSDMLEEQECLGLRENLNALERAEIETKIQLSGCTPLCVAAFNGHLSTVKVLANITGTVNANSGDKFIPLHYAIEGRNAEVISWLIEAGTKVNEADSEGNVALSRLFKNCLPGEELSSTSESKLNVMKLLIDKGADATTKNHRGRSCFGSAAYYKNLNVMELFIEKGVHVDYRDKENECTALRRAIELDHLEYVEYFLNKGANLNVKVNGMTSLDVALDKNFINWQIVRLLVEKDANVNYMRNLRVFAPLICAVEENQLDVAQYLVNKQSDATTTTDVSKMWTSLSIESLFILEIARNETRNYVRDLLIKNGKNMSATLFSSAVEESRAGFRKFALKKNYCVTLKILKGNSPFGKAVKIENWELVKLFVGNGVDVDYRDDDSEFTALHKAIKTDHLDYVKHFIEQLADVNLKVCEKTSLDLALENERVNWEMVRLLVESGADVKCRHNRKGYTPLHFAVEEDQLDMVEFLINKEADVLITDRSGVWTPPRLAHHLKRRKIMNFFKQRLV